MIAVTQANMFHFLDPFDVSTVFQNLDSAVQKKKKKKINIAHTELIVLYYSLLIAATIMSLAGWKIRTSSQPTVHCFSFT